MMRATITKSRAFIAVVLAVLVAFAAGFTQPATAKAATTDTIYVQGTADYAQAQEVLELVNEQRAAAGLSELTLDSTLTTAAMQRAAEISVYFSHTRPNGSDCLTVSSKASAENIAAGQTSASAVMTSWMGSSGHKANILDSSYKSIGIGCFTQNGTTYWVQLFGTSSASGSVSTTATTKTFSFKAASSYLNLSISSSSASSVTVGKSTTLQVVNKNLGFSSKQTTILAKSFKWTSGKTSVATVGSSTGKVTGVKAGTATITAKLSNTGKKATQSMTVKAASVAVTKVSLSSSSATLNVGATKTLTATVSPSNATNKTITWSSSNTSVATVSSSGKITAKAAGTATITAKTSNGKKATCKVTVKSVAVTKVSLSSSSATLNVGATKTLTATVTPSNATSKTITWSSSNTSVATVSSSGKVTAKAAGTATITAKTSNGKKATCKVTVKATSVAVTKVSLSSSKLVLSGSGTTSTLTATVSPSNATSKTITWSSSDTSIATVNSSGKVTAKSAGTCTITAKTSNGKKATCKVIVTGYVDTTEAYTLLNSFRTTSGVWYWNSNNTSKTYFNKSGYTTLSSLSKNSKLVTTAKTRAKELATLYSHTRPDGTSCFTAYSYSTAAENIAYGYTSCSAVITAWKEADEDYSGQGHRRNMLGSSYTAVGIAGYVASDGVTYWCMALAKA